MTFRTRLKAIFWDNDGILVETEHLYYQASRAALRVVDIDLSMDDFVRLTLGQGKSPLVLAEKRGLNPREIVELRQIKNRTYSELLQNGAAPMDGVRETLASLHGRVAMGIVTSSRRDHFDLIHRQNGLLEYFDFILTREDYPLSKPNPDPYLKALAVSGRPAEECLVIEDTPRGLLAARDAGLRCIVIPSSLAPASSYPGAFRVFSDLNRVREYLLREAL